METSQCKGMHAKASKRPLHPLSPSTGAQGQGRPRLAPRPPSLSRPAKGALSVVPRVATLILRNLIRPLTTACCPLASASNRRTHCFVWSRDVPLPCRSHFLSLCSERRRIRGVDFSSLCKGEGSVSGKANCISYGSFSCLLTHASLAASSLRNSSALCEQA